MNISAITLLDAGMNDNGKAWAKVEFRSLVGEPLAKVVVLYVGDSLTTEAPVSIDPRAISEV